MSAVVSRIFEDNFEEDNDSDNVLQFPTQRTTAKVAAKALSADEEKALISRAKKGDVKARNELTLANMKLVNSIAKKYEDRGLPFADLVQEGTIGLMSAVNKFDPKMGHRFSTYAAWWVREAITRALSNKSRIVRLPVHLNELMTKIRRVKSTLAVKLGRQATVAEIAQELNESVEKIAKALDASQVCMSLDQKVSTSDEDGFTLGETIVDDNTVSITDRANSTYLTSQIAELLSTLNGKERDVIRLRFGLDSGEEMSLRDIAEKLNLTRDQVGKISCLAMRKLKKAASKGDFEDYLAA